MGNDYILFIDTEASGLPKNWNLPYSADANWPHAVQVSWIIYDKEHVVVKKQDYYLSNNGFTINPEAIQIHGLTHDFLAENGKTRDEVMRLLADDVVQYQPMIVGHFVRLDYYILGAAFYRSGMANPLSTLPVFCTMVATRRLTRSVVSRHLRLGELYNLLFRTELKGQHNALNDAQATADCYFELISSGQVTEKSISEQTIEFEHIRDPASKKRGCLFPALIIIILLAIIIIYRL